MNIKEKVETLQKMKRDYVVEYDNSNRENKSNLIELKSKIDNILKEINQLEDLWLDGVQNV